MKTERKGVIPDEPGSSASQDTNPEMGWAVMSTQIAAIGLYAGAGYGLDQLLGTSFLVVVGLLVGVVAGLYLVYIRYGQ